MTIMLISYSWLKQYVGLPDSLTPEELALQLTMSTVEIEGFVKQAERLENIVVGEIRGIKKHPNANKLKLCQVDIGDEELKIVCGGSNLKKGMKVALAKVGARVKWHGEGDLVELKKTEIRGQTSAGMICQSTEIGLSDLFPLKDKLEILDLSDSKAKPGMPLAKALDLDDVVFDIDNKSMTHRPDLWGHYGLAREVAALHQKKISSYAPPEIKAGKEIKIKIKLEDKELCPRYMAVAVDGIKVEPSPDWLQKRLLAVGLRPINNIVDITNFILLDLGQPMHAFDAARLQGAKNKKQGTNIDVVVRRAKDGEKFKTLDEKEHELNSDMLVIANEKEAVALAGIMGGENSEVSEKTKMIVFESANFDATNVRRTAMALGIRTDSSIRFEKSLDPNNAELALRRAVQMVLELCPQAKVISNVADKASFHLAQGPIQLSLDFLKKKIGIEITKTAVVDILEQLGFEVKDKKDTLAVKVPTWRATKDISIPEDLVEEIARIYGYGNIETSLPVFPVKPPERNRLRDLERRIKQIVALEFGYTESYNYSFVSPNWLEKMGIDISRHIELENPMAKDRPILRRSLLPNLLENVEKNLPLVDNLRLFEIGKIFNIENPGERAEKNSDDLLPRQDLMLGIVFTEKNIEVPFYQLSSTVLGMLARLGYEVGLERKASQFDSYLHSARQAEIIIGDEVVGTIGELDPIVQKNLGIDAKVAVAELNINRLLEFYQEKSNYKPLPQYPLVERDIAFVVDKQVEHKDIVKVLENVDSLIVAVELFDVYESANVGKDKKSLAYHIVYRSDEKTLKASEVDEVHSKVAKMVEEEFGAEIRM